MYKIAVLGDYDSIYGFGALGLDIYPVSGPEEAKQEFKKLTSGSYAVIYITEAMEAVLSQDIEKFEDCVMPVIIRIPGISGNTGNGVKGVKHCVEQAVGSDILFGNS